MSNDCKLYLSKPNADFMKKSFSYRGGSVWNNPAKRFCQWIQAREKVDNMYGADCSY